MALGVVVVVGGRPTTGVGAVVAVLGVPSLVVIRLLPPDRLYAHAANVTELSTYPILLVGAALLYVYFRLTPDAGTAGLAAAAVFGTAQGLGYVATRIVLEDQVRAQPVWLLLSQVLVAGILVVLLALGRHWRGADPLQVGLCLAIVVSVGRLILVERAIPATTLDDSLPLLGGVLLLLYGALALLLLRNLRLPAWATWRLALAMSLLGVAHLLTYPVAEPDWHSVLAIGGNVAGATLLVMASPGSSAPRSTGTSRRSDSSAPSRGTSGTNAPSCTRSPARSRASPRRRGC